MVGGVVAVALLIRAAEAVGPAVFGAGDAGLVLAGAVGAHSGGCLRRKWSVRPFARNDVDDAADGVGAVQAARWEERRVGKEWCRKCRSWGWADSLKKNKT